MKIQKALFRDSGRTPGAVTLNTLGTPEREFGLYAEAFHEAGRALVQGLKSDPKFGLSGLPLDSFKAVPVVYLYRHALELSLKSIILAGSDIHRLRGRAKLELRTIHKLDDLTNDVAQIFEAYGWDWDFNLPDFRTLANFRSIVRELDTVEEVRYPTHPDGAAVLERDLRFNLFEFCELLDPVYEILSLREFAVLAQLQSEYEMRAERSQYDAGSGFSPDGY